MNKTFSLCFLIKRSKLTSRGLVPIYLRVTIDGRSTELSTKRFIDPEKWNGKGQRHKGFSEENPSIAFLKPLSSLFIKLTTNWN